MGPWLPTFRAGQVVTDRELNALSGHGLGRAMEHVRQHIGCGVVFGLEGGVTEDGTHGVVQPGEAIDALGRRLQVREALRTVLVGEAFEERLYESNDDVRAVDGCPYENVTAVLVHKDIVRPGGVGEDCVGRAGDWKRDGVELQFVRGRLAPPEPGALLRAVPLRMPSGRAIADGSGFRIAFERTRNLLCDGLFDTDLPADKHRLLAGLALQQRVDEGVWTDRDVLAWAVLNDVVYSGWQYARALLYERLHTRDCQGPECRVRDGVAIGWLFRHPENGWVWDSRWRRRFAIGSTELEQVKGYRPVLIKAVALRRIARALERWNARHVEPTVRFVSLRGYRGGTAAWLPNLGWDRPCPWTGLWPLDPLRGACDPPASALPTVDRDSGERRVGADRSARPLPSLIDPVNEPYWHQSYDDTTVVDPRRQGLAALSNLLGRPLREAWQVLLSAYRHCGREDQLSPAVRVDQLPDVVGWEHCTTVALDARLAMVVDDDLRVVSFLTPAYRGVRRPVAKRRQPGAGEAANGPRGPASRSARLRWPTRVLRWFLGGRRRDQEGESMP
ncbi:MAG: hypothetical protein ACE37K_03755 [Planctomycetota bacterium]